MSVYAFPPIIKGGWQLAGGHGPVRVERALADMRAYFDAGITTFDCADIYTGVEDLIGQFRSSLSPAERAKLRVHTKVVPDLAKLSTLEFADIERSIDRSRTRLGVDTIDLAQLHWWDYGAPAYVAAASHLKRLQAMGKIRDIGVTNFSTGTVRAMLDRGVPIVSHQVQYSVLDRRPATTMATLCAAHGIALLCYGSLAGGFLSERWLGVPEPEEPFENRSLTKYKLVIDEFGGWSSFQDLLAVLRTVAVRHEVGIGTVALRWTLDQPGVRSVIVGARNAVHLRATLQAKELTLHDADRAEIESVLKRAKGPAGDVYELERDRTGRHGRIMRYDLSDNDPLP